MPTLTHPKGGSSSADPDTDEDVGSDDNSPSPVSISGVVVCGLIKSLAGCLLRAAIPRDKCSVPGCIVLFHHCCAAHWEDKQHQQNNPAGHALLTEGEGCRDANNPYDSGGGNSA